jgi:hypothetical protein
VDIITRTIIVLFLLYWRISIKASREIFITFQLHLA